jgi:hypothetical protein
MTVKNKDIAKILKHISMEDVLEFAYPELYAVSSPASCPPASVVLDCRTGNAVQIKGTPWQFIEANGEKNFVVLADLNEDVLKHADEKYSETVTNNEEGPMLDESILWALQDDGQSHKSWWKEFGKNLNLSEEQLKNAQHSANAEDREFNRLSAFLKKIRESALGGAHFQDRRIKDPETTNTIFYKYRTKEPSSEIARKLHEYVANDKAVPRAENIWKSIRIDEIINVELQKKNPNWGYIFSNCQYNAIFLGEEKNYKRALLCADAANFLSQNVLEICPQKGQIEVEKILKEVHGWLALAVEREKKHEKDWELLNPFKDKSKEKTAEISRSI